MSEDAAELTPSKLAFRVMLFAGALALVGWMPAGFQTIAGVVLLLAAAALGYEGWARSRGAMRRQNLLWGALSLGGAGVLLGGLIAFLALPLLVLAAVCAALSVIAMLGEASEAPPG
jgi:hypothetical protein